MKNLITLLVLTFFLTGCYTSFETLDRRVERVTVVDTPRTTVIYNRTQPCEYFYYGYNIYNTCDMNWWLVYGTQHTHTKHCVHNKRNNAVTRRTNIPRSSGLTRSNTTRRTTRGVTRTTNRVNRSTTVRTRSNNRSRVERTSRSGNSRSSGKRSSGNRKRGNN